VKLVQTLVVRDEADVVDAQLAYHLNAGVDFVLATDHASQDGTTEILEWYEREGYLHLFRVEGDVRESEWRTRMARLAATEYGADWVINTDADEFWLPRAGTLKDVFAAAPARCGVFWAVSRHFVPRPDDRAPFAERMTARFSPTAALNDPTSPYRPHAKAAHRADPGIVVLFGSHRVVTRLAPLPAWHPADVLHFPFRSLEQYERKTVRRAHGDKGLGQYVKGAQALERGRIRDVYAGLLIDDDALERGRADGSLAVDTRLRDTLRELRRGDTRSTPGGFRLRGLDDAPRVAAADASHEPTVDAAAFREAEVVRLMRSLDGLRARLRPVESRLWARGRRRAASKGR
jgi:glycosyl transferase family 2